MADRPTADQEIAWLQGEIIGLKRHIERLTAEVAALRRPTETGMMVGRFPLDPRNRTVAPGDDDACDNQQRWLDVAETEHSRLVALETAGDAMADVLNWLAADVRADALLSQEQWLTADTWRKLREASHGS